MPFLRLCLFAVAPLLLIPASVPAQGVAVPARFGPTRIARPWIAQSRVHPIGLGKIVATSDGGQIYGFDVNQNGNDGALASAQTLTGAGDMLVSMQTFDQTTANITKTFQRYHGKQYSYTFDAITAGDVGLVTAFFVPNPSNPAATQSYRVMNPVTAGTFTGRWTPPVSDIRIEQVAENQATATTVLYGIELKNGDAPDLIVSNIAANTVSNVIHLDPLFGLGSIPQLAQYTTAGAAVIALTPDAGTPAGAAPLNVLIDLKTGKEVRFNGYNGGFYGAGTVNGLAVDPNTGIAATATELNAQVEFYDLTKRTGIAAVQLPCSGNTDQLLSGAGVAVDPVNKLFLVAEPYYCGIGHGSAVIVYDERGNRIETITGFTFAVNEPPVRVNPSRRTGWAFGPNSNQLQQFFY